MFQMSGYGSDDRCGRIRELVVWLPSGTLDEAERAEAEKHVAGCPACADLLKFASTLKGALRKQASPHPDADALVRFAEDRARMDPRARSRVENHLSACPDCRKEVAMLEAVDKDVSEAVSPVQLMERARGGPTGLVSGLRLFWDSLRGSILRPVPAAVYLVLAAVGIGLYIARPAMEPGVIPGPRESDIGDVSGLSGVSGMLGGIVILPDQTGRMREPGVVPAEVAEIDAGRTQFLLLELIGLQSPPAAEDLYTAQVLADASAEPVFTASVMGREFRDNYTLCLSLGEGGLLPGAYTVRVVAPDGKPVFRSSILAR